MEGSLAYPPPHHPTNPTTMPPHPQSSSFGIDNILTGINNGASAVTLGGRPHYNGYATATTGPNNPTNAMILQKIDATMNNEQMCTKRESISSMEDDDDGFRKKKKPRTAFSREQVAELEKKFNDKKYLSSAERGELAEKLKLSDMQVKTWFQNRRMKYKRQSEEAEMELKSPKYPYAAPFVPYTSIYSYMPYKTPHEFGGNTAGGNGPLYHHHPHPAAAAHLHSCSQQYNTTIANGSGGSAGTTSPPNAESYSNGANTTTPPMMSPQYSPNQPQHRGFNGFFNRGGGMSPLSSPSTPNVSSGNGNFSGTTGGYFNGDYVATAQYSE